MGKEGKSFEKDQAESRESIERSIKNILIVEDTSENMEAAKSFFEEGESKVNVTYCSNVEEAMKALQNEKFDCVLTDMIMPKPEDYSNEIEKEAKEMTEKILGVKTKVFTSQTESEWEETFKDLNGPCGLMIAEEAIKKEIPVGIISFLGHHSKYEWAFSYAARKFGTGSDGKKIGWQGGYCPDNKFALITDTSFGLLDSKEDFKDKSQNWKLAFQTVKTLINENRFVLHINKIQENGIEIQNWSKSELEEEKINFKFK